MSNRPRPIALLILDGWGHREEQDSNAIAAAHTPNWDRLWEQGAHALVETSGINVGLPQGQMGNSEVGHLNLGSGRVVYQEYTRITAAIEDGSFAENPALLHALQAAKAAGGGVHMFGLMSPGGVHSHEAHLQALVRLAAAQGVRIYVHAMLDGRDMPPRSAAASLEAMHALCDELNCGRIATLCGRYFAMDRDNRWDRIERAYRLYTEAEAEFSAPGAAAGLAAAYERGENDEFVQPTVIGRPRPIRDGDSIVFMNFRADRAREITRAFIEDDFAGFERRRRPKLADYACLTRYHKEFDTPVAYPPEDLPNTLGAYIADLGLSQLRIAETEKYAHVTFFFNGGREEPFPNEDRILVPSPRVATYDLKPEMSAYEVADKLAAAVRTGKYDLIVCNFANADMVGHTGKFDAAVAAIEALDRCIGQVADALAEVGGELLVTADHGNAEKMTDEHTGQAHTAHTTCKVPLLYVGRPATLKPDGALSDIAPTLLKLMDLKQPAEMTGHSLVELTD